MIHVPAWLQWLACLAIPGILIALAIHEGRRSRRIDPPLPTAEATYIPAEGSECQGAGHGYYARDERVKKQAEADIRRAGLSVRMTSERLHESTRRLNERKRNEYN